MSKYDDSPLGPGFFIFFRYWDKYEGTGEGDGNFQPVVVPDVKPKPKESVRETIDEVLRELTDEPVEIEEIYPPDEFVQVDIDASLVNEFAPEPDYQERRFFRINQKILEIEIKDFEQRAENDRKKLKRKLYVLFALILDEL